MSELRRGAYRLMLVVTVAAMTARVASSERVYEPSLHRADFRSEVASITAPFMAASPVTAAIVLTVSQARWVQFGPDPSPRIWPANRPWPMPTFGSNDRSRWATIRALVEDGTFVIGRRTYLPGGGYRDTGRVFEPGYESIDKVLHPDTNEFYSSKPPLFAVLLAGEYWMLYRLGFDLEHDRWLVIRVIVWSSNVLPLAVFLWLLAGVVERYGRTDWGRFFTYAAACFGTFLPTFSITLNNHVPAAVAAFLAVYPWLSAESEPPWSLGRLVVSGLFAGLAACLELPAAALLGGLFVGLLARAPGRTLAAFLPAAALPVAAQLGLNIVALGDPVPAYAKFGEGAGAWYDYPGSVWRRETGEVKHGIDWAKDYESRRTYAFHLLIGHHGLFSLTPIWLFSFAAMLAALPRIRAPGRLFEPVLILSLLVSLAVIVFFVTVVGTVNYGGWTSGPRWLFWLSPLWLVALVPAADWLASARWGRALGLAVLAVSVFSASYPAWNPWRHPWIYNLLESLGRIPYGK